MLFKSAGLVFLDDRKSRSVSFSELTNCRCASLSRKSALETRGVSTSTQSTPPSRHALHGFESFPLHCMRRKWTSVGRSDRAIEVIEVKNTGRPGLTRVNPTLRFLRRQRSQARCVTDSPRGIAVCCFSLVSRPSIQLSCLRRKSKGVAYYLWLGEIWGEGGRRGGSAKTCCRIALSTNQREEERAAGHPVFPPPHSPI
jgi:hypothetical protein